MVGEVSINLAVTKALSEIPKRKDNHDLLRNTVKGLYEEG